MNPIVWVIFSVILGAVGYTLWGFLWAKVKNSGEVFNRSYLFSMLITMAIAIIAIPLLLNNQVITVRLLPIMLAGSFAIGFALNFMINTPLTHMLNLNVALQKAANVTVTSASVEHRIVEVLGIILLIALVCGAGVYAAVTYSATITATGTITGVGVNVYADSGYTIPLTTINWGTINPGGYATSTIYLKSTSNTGVTLYLATNAWTPASIQQYLTLSWNYNNATIEPNGEIAIVLTLAASSQAPPGTSFTVNIVITAES